MNHSISNFHVLRLERKKVPTDEEYFLGPFNLKNPYNLRVSRPPSFPIRRSINPHHTLFHHRHKQVILNTLLSLSNCILRLASIL